MKVRYVIQTTTRGPCTKCTPPCRNDLVLDVTYTLADGTPITGTQPGDVYFGEDHRGKYECSWSNCDGRHLYCILPDGHPWNIDGRASNCTMQEDRLHRCWCRHGDPASGNLHVDKIGVTCQAGAGSIAVDGFHGFLHNGELNPC